VNVLSGILASAVLIAARQISSGDSAKYFLVILSIAVSTTLISYLAVFPALWRLRVSHPDHPRPYRAPWAPFLSILLTGWILFATIELLFPGLGAGWFSDDFRPDGWEEAEKWKYTLTELIPLLAFVLLGIIFYAVSAKTRKNLAASNMVGK